jgi:cellulose synthase/poly-beta-1,6-N-acetylglucosamine synthase-like glycosyltransferase
MRVSLIIPLRNEEPSFPALAATILAQTIQPFETIFVDGGSTDNTAQIVQRFCESHPQFKLVRQGPTMPGKARNIGAQHALGNWLAFTDGGIRLDKDWLKELIAAIKTDTLIVYGNYHPCAENFFTTCATIAYCAPLKTNAIRGKFIASSLVRKDIWDKAGGFPDWRAAEDIIFMEKAEEAANHKFAMAPKANVYWSLRPNLISTFKRFDLYSMYNVWAKQQKYWHYGVLRQYILLMAFVLLSIFHTPWWLLLILIFYGLRTLKRMWSHQLALGKKMFFQPLLYLQVFVITLVMDAATFSGWLKAIFNKKSIHQPSTA